MFGIDPVDDLGEDHGDGLQRVDFLIAIETLGPVLHREHADDAPAAQDRHTEESVERVLPVSGR